MKTRKLISVAVALGVLMAVAPNGFASSIDDAFVAGGDRLTALQQNDGGWDWPLDDGDPNDPSPTNTAAPIAMGLLSAYLQTGTSAYLDGAVAAGDFIMAVSPPHSTGNGIFMDALSDVTGDSSYADDVRTEYYDALAAGTYDRNGTQYSTNTWGAFLLGVRGNLASWDIGLAAVGAHRLGADTTDWVTAIENSINAMTLGNSWDVLGLAGGVWTLAELGIDFDPTAGAFAGADSTADLAAILASYQIDGGGFAWRSDYVIADDGNEAEQETAYAMLALNAFDSALYEGTLTGATNYLIGAQLATGGWGSGENNEVTGEALLALDVAGVPEPMSMVMLSCLGAGMFGARKLRRKKR